MTMKTIIANPAVDIRVMSSKLYDVVAKTVMRGILLAWSYPDLNSTQKAIEHPDFQVARKEAVRELQRNGWIAPKNGVDAWTAEDQALLDQKQSELRQLEEKRKSEVSLNPTTLDQALEMTRQAFIDEKASIIAFFPKMEGGPRIVSRQAESDLNFNLKARKPHRFALFRVTEEGYRIGAAFIINIFGVLDTKEFRQKVETPKATIQPV